MKEIKNKIHSGRLSGLQPVSLAILFSLSFCHQPGCYVLAQDETSETPPFNSQLVESQESEMLLSAVDFAHFFSPAGLSWGATAKSAHPVVLVVAPGSRAADAGIKEGSILIEIDGVDTRFLGYQSLFDLLWEHKGIPCPILLKDTADSAPRTVVLVVPEGRFVNRIKTQNTENKNAKVVDSTRHFDVPYIVASETLSTPMLLEFTDNSDKYKPLSKEIFAEVTDTETGKKFPSIKHRMESVDSPLAKHFQVQDVPTYVFVVCQFSRLSEGEDIIRTEMSEKELVGRLNRLRVDWYVRKTGTGEFLGIEPPIRMPRRQR